MGGKKELLKDVRYGNGLEFFNQDAFLHVAKKYSPDPRIDSDPTDMLFFDTSFALFRDEEARSEQS